MLTFVTLDSITLLFIFIKRTYWFLGKGSYWGGMGWKGEGGNSVETYLRCRNKPVLVIASIYKRDLYYSVWYINMTIFHNQNRSKPLSYYFALLLLIFNFFIPFTILSNFNPLPTFQTYTMAFNILHGGEVGSFFTVLIYERSIGRQTFSETDRISVFPHFYGRITFLIIYSRYSFVNIR